MFKVGDIVKHKLNGKKVFIAGLVYDSPSYGITNREFIQGKLSGYHCTIEEGVDLRTNVYFIPEELTELSKYED